MKTGSDYIEMLNLSDCNEILTRYCLTSNPAGFKSRFYGNQATVGHTKTIRMMIISLYALRQCIISIFKSCEDYRASSHCIKQGIHGRNSLVDIFKSQPSLVLVGISFSRKEHVVCG